MAKRHLKLVDADLILALEDEADRGTPESDGFAVPVNAAVAASVLSDPAVVYAPPAA